MPRKKHPLILLEGGQIKSAEKLRRICAAITVLEEEFGIREVTIMFQDVFICPWIDLLEFTNSKDPMEQLIGGLCIKLDIMKHGKNSKYKKANG